MEHFTIKDIEPRRPADGVEIRAVSGERMTVAFFHLAPGSAVPEHAHPHEQIGTVLKGVMNLVIGGEEIVVSEGGVYIIPPDVPHSGQCGDMESDVIEVFSPVREDMK